MLQKVTNKDWRESFQELDRITALVPGKPEVVLFSFFFTSAIRFLRAHGGHIAMYPEHAPLRCPQFLAMYRCHPPSRNTDFLTEMYHSLCGFFLTLRYVQNPRRSLKKTTSLPHKCSARGGNGQSLQYNQRTIA